MKSPDDNTIINQSDASTIIDPCKLINDEVYVTRYPDVSDSDGLNKT